MKPATHVPRYEHGSLALPANGLAKLAEECGELLQVVGKVLAYGSGPHPDGTPSLAERLENEIADVTAAIELVAETHALDTQAISQRVDRKLALFREWQQDPDNATNQWRRG